MARSLRHRPDRNGSVASLTASAPVDRNRATRQLLLGAAAILLLALARATALSVGVSDLVVGAAFGTALLLAAMSVPAVRRRLRGLPAPSSLFLGAALGATLLVPGGWMRAHGAIGPGAVVPGVYALAWVPLIALISAGEEALLRGWMQPLARQAWGPGLAIVFVGAVFAAMHVPIYGWVAVPLDLGVGILFGCLREYSGSVAACGLAHVLADLGHWWLP
ncbi:MAG TPA: CPBP family intramembrane glutamic endopeptidase [Candidatus Dormibacteraeota bacterium]|nr:CPBP family intramembrane glutamic endopeptidase [Candidatus Dormibacteraeota bacterium]